MNHHVGSLDALLASNPEFEIVSGASVPFRPVVVDTHIAHPAENNVCMSTRRSATAESVSTETKNDNAGTHACRRLAAWYDPNCESCRALAHLSADHDVATSLTRPSPAAGAAEEGATQVH